VKLGLRRKIAPQASTGEGRKKHNNNKVTRSTPGAHSPFLKSNTLQISVSNNAGLIVSPGTLEEERFKQPTLKTRKNSGLTKTRATHLLKTADAWTHIMQLTKPPEYTNSVAPKLLLPTKVADKFECS
jgi:hypothetical protein